MVLIPAAAAMPMIGCGKGKPKGDPYVFGVIAMKNQQYDKAIEHFEEAAKEKPDNTKILLALGKAHLRNSAFDKAIEQFKKALRLDENILEAHLQIAEAELSLAGIAASGSADAREVLGHYLNAQAQCTQALDKDPTLAQAYVKLSLVFEIRGDMLEEALAEINKALDLDPHLIEAYVAKARLLRRGDSDKMRAKAVTVLTTGLEKIEERLKAEMEEAKEDEEEIKSIKSRADSDRFRLNWAIARIQTRRGQIAEAIERFTAILDYATSPAEANAVRYELGELYLGRNNLDAVEEQAYEIQKVTHRSGAVNYLLGRAALARGRNEKDRKKRDELMNTAVNNLAVFSQSTRPQELFWLGQAYRFRRGRDDVALTEFRKALKNIDEDRQMFLASRIHLAMADVLVRKARYEEAESHCRQVLKLRRSHAEAMMTLAHVLIMTGRRPEAEKLIEQVAEFEPASVLAQLQLARMKLYSRQPEQALLIVQEVLRLPGEKDPAAYHLEGTIHKAMRHYEEAVVSFETALVADPSFSAAYVSLARAHIDNDQQDKATALLKKYMKEQPAQAEAPTFLARIYEHLGDTDSAIRYYQEALKRTPKYTPAYSIARLYLLTGKIDSAIQKWRELLVIGKENQVRMVGSRLNLALALMLKKDPDQALLEAQELQTEDEAQESALSLFRILVALSTQDYEKARAVLHDTRGQTPNNKMPVDDFIKDFEADPGLGQQVLAKLAYSMIDRNEYQLAPAEQHVKEAIELMPNSLMLHAHLAHIYARTSRWDELTEECKKMTDLDPRYASPHIYLARLADANNKTDEAITEYANAAKLDTRAVAPMIRLAQITFAQAQALQRSLRAQDNPADAEKTIQDIKRQHDDVLLLVSEVLALDEQNLRALALRASVFRAQGNADAAERVLHDIIAKHPDRPYPISLLAQYKLDTRKYDEAIELCDAGLRLAKDSTVFRQIKAGALVRRGQRGDIDRAITMLREALSINDLNVKLYITLARIYRAASVTISEAENLLRQGLKKQPASLKLKQELTEVYIMESKLDEAEKLVEEIIAAAKTARTTLLKSQLDLIRALNTSDVEEKNKRLEEIIAGVGKVTSSSDKAEVYEAYLLLGKVRLQGYDDKTSATQAFEEAKKLFPGRPEPDVWLAPIYFQQGLFTKSATSLEGLGKNAFTTARLAIARHADRNLTAAERIARKALTLPPERKDSCKVVLANILLDAGRPEEAIEVMKTTRLDPEFIAGYEQLAHRLRDAASREAVATEINKAIFFTLSRMPKDAPEHYAAALKQAPDDNVFLLMFLARNLIEAMELDKAADNLQTVINARPNYIAPRIDLGRVREMQNNVPQALAAYLGASELSPDSPFLAFKIARLNHGSGNLPEAQKFYRRVIALDPNNTIAQFSLGLTYEKQGLIKKALEAYDKTIALAPGDPATAGAYNNAAWHYAIKENPNLRKALAYALKAKDLAPEQPEFRDTLGWTFFLRGDLDMAKQELQTSAMALADRGTVQYHYAVVLEKLGEKDHAIRVLESAVVLDFSVEYDKKKAQEMLHKLKGTN